MNSIKLALALVFIMSFNGLLFSQYVSDFHKAHQGEMLFTKASSIDLKKDIQFDEIQSVIYLPGRIDKNTSANGTSTGSAFFIKIYYDGELFSDVYSSSLDAGSESAFTVKIFGKYSGLLLKDAFFQKYKSLEAGDHSIKYEVYGGTTSAPTKAPIAKGEMTLTKNPSEKEKVYGKWSDVETGMSNAKLEQQTLDVVNATAEKENWKERYTKAKITSGDWVTIRDKWTNIITGRELYLVLYGVWPDGKCKKLEVSIWQDFNGYQYSNEITVSIGAMWLIECED